MHRQVLRTHYDKCLILSIAITFLPLSRSRSRSLSRWVMRDNCLPIVLVLTKRNLIRITALKIRFALRPGAGSRSSDAQTGTQQKPLCSLNIDIYSSHVCVAAAIDFLGLVCHTHTLPLSPCRRTLCNVIM
jgi:hypothetical protein